jgi:hypothetical protein
MQKELFWRGHERWSFLYISVSTTGTDILDFVNSFLRKYKDIHVEWYYYIQGGFGSAFMELGTDGEGNFYEIFTRIDIEETEENNYDFDFHADEYYGIPKEGELEWDEERLQQPHWYEIKEEIPTEEELEEDNIRMLGWDHDDWCKYKDKKKAKN